MKAGRVYSRKISSGEAREGYILVLKDKLSTFPPLGKTFDLVKGDVSKRAKVESYPCTCRGPDLPHEHYFIRWSGLEAGDKIEIEKDVTEEGRYLLRVHG